MVKKTIVDSLHKEGKSQRVIISERGNCSQSAVCKLENTVKQSRFKRLGELHKEWTEAGVTTLRRLLEKGFQATSETKTTSETSLKEALWRFLISFSSRTLTPKQPSGKDHWNQLSPYTDFAVVGTNCRFFWPENWPPDWVWFLPGFFSLFCHRWSFGSLPLSPLACLVGDTSFPVISKTWLQRYNLLRPDKPVVCSNCSKVRL